MLTDIHPKLPMRNKKLTLDYYLRMGFKDVGTDDYNDYLILEREQIQIHFFSFKDLQPADNYGQVYCRTDDIDNLYQSMIDAGLPIHPAGKLQVKPWGQKEFSMLDPDKNLLTFGQNIR